MDTAGKKELVPLTERERVWLRAYVDAKILYGYAVYTNAHSWKEDHQQCDIRVSEPIFWAPPAAPTSLRVAHCTNHPAVYINHTDEDDFVTWVREVRSGIQS